MCLYGVVPFHKFGDGSKSKVGSVYVNQKFLIKGDVYFDDQKELKVLTKDTVDFTKQHDDKYKPVLIENGVSIVVENIIKNSKYSYNTGLYEYYSIDVEIVGGKYNGKTLDGTDLFDYEAGHLQYDDTYLEIIK